MFAFIRNLFKRFDPLAPLKAVMPELKQLDNDLATCWQTYGDPLLRIAPFFNIVSKWHDRDGFGEAVRQLRQDGPKYQGYLVYLDTLQKHFANAGRCEYGWNRTKPGEQVTADRVFLGDIFGLFTKPVSYWLTLKLELQPGEVTHPAAPGKSPRELVTNQAYQFMWSHVCGIRETIAELDRALQPADKRATVRPTPAMA